MHSHDPRRDGRPSDDAADSVETAAGTLSRRGPVRCHGADAIEGSTVAGWSLLPTIDPVTHRPCHRTAIPTRDPAVDLAALPTDPAARVRALEQIVDQQAALLDREDEVHRVLVRIVLAGGALAELGDAVAGFFGGAPS